MQNNDEIFDFDAAMADLEEPIKTRKPGEKRADHNYNSDIRENSNVVKMRPVKKNYTSGLQRSAKASTKCCKLDAAKEEFEEQNPGLI